MTTSILHVASTHDSERRGSSIPKSIPITCPCTLPSGAAVELNLGKTDAGGRIPFRKAAKGPNEVVARGSCKNPTISVSVYQSGRWGKSSNDVPSGQV